MALNIRNPEVERLTADLAFLTGESKTDAVKKALQFRLDIVKRQQRKRHIADRLNEIANHCAGLPVLDNRSAEDMLYDDHGLPI